jgi:hypothetical protein
MVKFIYNKYKTLPIRTEKPLPEEIQSSGCIARLVYSSFAPDASKWSHFSNDCTLLLKCDATLHTTLQSFISFIFYLNSDVSAQSLG